MTPSLLIVLEHFFQSMARSVAQAQYTLVIIFYFCFSSDSAFMEVCNFPSFIENNPVSPRIGAVFVLANFIPLSLDLVTCRQALIAKDCYKIEWEAPVSNSRFFQLFLLKQISQQGIFRVAEGQEKVQGGW